MKLYLMRHGPAEDHARSGRDFDRALTHAGRERVRAVAKRLVADDEAPRLIISSPLVRALQTAEIVAAVTKLEGHGGVVVARRELEPGGDGVALVEELLGSSEEKRVMLVGHEPDISALAVALSGHPMPEGMTKGMVVALTGEGGARPLRQRVRVRWVLDPKTLAVSTEM